MTPAHVTEERARPGVLILSGQTASGKSALALQLAERFGAEIVGADSRQIYRAMPIGTAAPSEADRARIPHHLVGFLDPRERYSAARFVQDALAAIAAIHARGRRALVVGGTGFYVRALAGDVTLSPVRDEALRERLAREARLHPTEVLADWLRALAPARAAAVPPGDAYRVTRALEIALAERDGAPNISVARSMKTANSTAPADANSIVSAHTALADDATAPDAPRLADSLRARGIPYRKLYLDIAPETLQARIAARVETMLAAGLPDEAERIGADAVAADAVGYREALAYLAGFSTADELRAHLIRSTRRYAKRQATWFRIEPDLVRISAENAFAQAAAHARELPGWS
ncbi:MAG: tRNA dimethylallyltransferase [Candidatus Eremiobacteraeota bacterium]|nr:tRNA dimethylallyltransferase [Candidatus Eremiobacteraeota bacterium]